MEYIQLKFGKFMIHRLTDKLHRYHFHIDLIHKNFKRQLRLWQWCKDSPKNVTIRLEDSGPGAKSLECPFDPDDVRFFLRESRSRYIIKLVETTKRYCLQIKRMVEEPTLHERKESQSLPSAEGTWMYHLNEYLTPDEIGFLEFLHDARSATFVRHGRPRRTAHLEFELDGNLYRLNLLNSENPIHWDDKALMAVHKKLTIIFNLNRMWLWFNEVLPSKPQNLEPEN